MTNKMYFVADPSEDYATVCDSFASAQTELFNNGLESELLFVADAIEVDVDNLTANVFAVLVNEGHASSFIQADHFDTFEDFAEEVDYRLNEAINFYQLDAHAYALSNVERYEVVKSLARC